MVSFTERSETIHVVGRDHRRSPAAQARRTAKRQASLADERRKLRPVVAPSMEILMHGVHQRLDILESRPAPVAIEADLVYVMM